MKSIFLSFVVLSLLCGCSKREIENEVYVVQIVRNDVVGRAVSRYEHDIVLDPARDTLFVANGDFVLKDTVLVERSHEAAYSILSEYEFELEQLVEELAYLRNQEGNSDFEIREVHRNMDSLNFKIKNLNLYDVYTSAFSGVVMVKSDHLKLISQQKDLVIDANDYQIADFPINRCFQIRRIDDDIIGEACVAFVLPGESLMHKVYLAHEIELYENQTVFVLLDTPSTLIDINFIGGEDGQHYVVDEDMRQYPVRGRRVGVSDFEVFEGVFDGQVLIRVSHND